MPAFDDMPQWATIAATGQAQVLVLHVQRWDATRDGVLTASRLRQRLEGQGLWVSERRYAPGVSQDETSADHDSVQVVLRGLLKLSAGGETAILSAGDAAFVPRGVPRHVEVIGSTSVVAYAGAFLPNGPWAGRPRLPRSIWR